MARGRPQGEPLVVKHDVGRIWPRGFTRDGVLYAQVSAGFAEVLVTNLEGGEGARPQVITPRQAVSNFYPVWSRDGRYLAYASERRADLTREVWVYDTTSRQELRVPIVEKIGRPFDWSPDANEILVAGANDQRALVIDRVSGRTRLVGEGILRAAWGPAGIVALRRGEVVVYDAASLAVTRRFDFAGAAPGSFDPSRDGRSVLSMSGQGRMRLQDVAGRTAHEWHDGGILWLVAHQRAPHTASTAYLTQRKGVGGEVRTLMIWPGAGDPREVLRVPASERLSLVGWTPDAQHLLVIRGALSASGRATPALRIWRVPVTGGTALPTEVSAEALRDVSLHPDGRRVAFNAGFKRGEFWALENLVTR